MRHLRRVKEGASGMSSVNSRHGFQLRSINNVIKSLFQPRETDVNIPENGSSAHKRYSDAYYK